MKLISLSLISLFLILCPVWLSAQAGRPAMKFGDVSSATFTPSVYTLDSSANAVILFDKGHVSFDRAARNGYGFSIVFERHTRIRLLHKNAFGLATVILARSKKVGAGMEIGNMKGATYNLEDGNVVVSNVDKSSIFKEENGDYVLEKMALPNVKEGSVIEYSYRIVYPGFGYMPSWEFQGEYPILWSEYDIMIPTALEYIVERQGYLKFAIDSSRYTTMILPINIPSGGIYGAYNSTWRGEAVERTWAIQDAPPLAKREAYITTLKNYISKIEFQLSAIHLPGAYRNLITNWDVLVDELMKSEKFGEPLTDRNHWMTDECKKISGTDNTSIEAAQKIYHYVRDQFECSGAEGIYLSQPLKKTWEDKKGNVADINLLLTALYQHQGFDAAPVILSSRSHGRAFEDYPLLKDYNYVITRMTAGDQTWLLDASKNNIGFGRLPELCYNGSGRIIDAAHQVIPLRPDSLTEKKSTVVVLNNGDSMDYSGSFNHIAGTFESMELRSRLKRIKPEDFFESLRKGLASNKTMEDGGIDSLDNLEEPVRWHYNMKYDFSSPTVYFNPIMHERTTTNPFNAPERHYPVEMPYCIDYSYVINMDIPKDYAVSEIPRSEKVLLDSGYSGMFEYLVEKDTAAIRMHFRLQIKKTYFGVDEYQGLRDFFAFIIRKEKEQFVFKKK
jgi:Transglutaminase-like superfamily